MPLYNYSNPSPTGNRKATLGVAPGGRGINPETARIMGLPGGSDYLAGWGPPPKGVNDPNATFGDPFAFLKRPTDSNWLTNWQNARRQSDGSVKGTTNWNPTTALTGLLKSIVNAQSNPQSPHSAAADTLLNSWRNAGNSIVNGMGGQSGQAAPQIAQPVANPQNPFANTGTQPWMGMMGSPGQIYGMAPQQDPFFGMPPTPQASGIPRRY